MLRTAEKEIKKEFLKMVSQSDLCDMLSDIFAEEQRLPTVSDFSKDTD
jgi:hypothetical protein